MKKLLDHITAEVTKAFVEAGYEEKFGRVTLSNRPDLCEFQCNELWLRQNSIKRHHS